MLEPKFGFPKNVDWLLLLLIAILSAVGLVMVASATFDKMDYESQNPWYYFIRQLIYLGAGIIAGLFVVSLPIKLWDDYQWHFLAISFLLLLAVSIFGVEINGAKRWLNIGGLSFQPSELVKLVGMSYIAGYLVRRRDELSSLSGFSKPFLFLVPMAFFFFKQPDFGATAILMIASLAMIILGGIRIRSGLFLTLLVFTILSIVVWLEEYRVFRLFSFLDPWTDPYGTGYQPIQAAIAFSRGGFWGEGLGGSIQKLYFLPDSHTDFIFAILAEELGLVGAIICVLLFAVLCLRSLQIGIKAQAHNLYAAYLAYGLSLLWIGQILINILVNIGWFPTKGLTLPFISYGGSSLVASCIAAAILLRIDYETRCMQESIISATELTEKLNGIDASITASHIMVNK